MFAIRTRNEESFQAKIGCIEKKNPSILSGPENRIVMKNKLLRWTVNLKL